MPPSTYCRPKLAARLSIRSRKLPSLASSSRIRFGCATSVAAGPDRGTTTSMASGVARVASTPERTKSGTVTRCATASTPGVIEKVTGTVRSTPGSRFASPWVSVSHGGGSAAWIV